MDPNVPGNDIAGGSKHIKLIFDRFAQARKEILAAINSSQRKSLLDWMLGGNYNMFLWHRKKLRELYEAKWGDPDSEYE
jgi:hypothetical protein